MYPTPDAAVIVCKFFQLYQNWKWPNPVQLCPVNDLGFGHKVWNPFVRDAWRPESSFAFVALD